MINEDNAEYFQFTGPQRLDKAIHTLEGIVEGISIDGKVTDKELSVLTRWIGEHEEFSNRHPFNEIIPRLHQILADGIVDDEEKADILWLCNKFSTDDSFFCHATSDMQRLQGVLGGIVADGVITETELRSLQEWLDEHAHLRTCWPYDEVESLCLNVLRDGTIDEKEQRSLLQFFNQFTQYNGRNAIDMPDFGEDALISGVCAVCPDIEFENRRFCFTGRSEKYTRQEFTKHITFLGGIFCKSLTKDTDYLIIGGDGNPCWAYACYGRKVEQAIQHRKTGGRILLVHEYDLWDALEDSRRNS